VYEQYITSTHLRSNMSQKPLQKHQPASKHIPSVIPLSLYTLGKYDTVSTDLGIALFLVAQARNQEQGDIISSENVL